MLRFTFGAICSAAVLILLGCGGRVLNLGEDFPISEEPPNGPSAAAAPGAAIGPQSTPACYVGEISCKGQTLRLCTGDGWVDWQQCEAPYICGASDGNKACIEGSPCNLGDSRCSGTTFEVCMGAEPAWEAWPQCAGACGETPDRSLPAYCK